MKKTLIMLIMVLIVFSAAVHADAYTYYTGNYVEGFLKHISTTAVQIEAYDGSLHTLAVSPQTKFLIDNRPVSLKAFKPGMEILARVRGKTAFLMEGFSTQIPGYIPPGGKVRLGVVKTIDRDQIIMTTPTHEDKTYFVSPATIVLKDGEAVDFTTLYEGDRVKLYFDTIDSKVVSRMHIQGDSIRVSSIYRGKIGFYDNMGENLVVENPQILRNGEWTEAGAALKIDCADEITLYSGGRKLPLRYLKYLRGRTVYFAAKEVFGSEKIFKMVVKQHYESVYNDKIEDVNWYSESMELSNNKNLKFYDGTIVVKHGRLVDTYSINPDSDALIVAEGLGRGTMANLIYILNESINNSNIGQHYLYTGRIQQIVMDKLVLEDFFILNENQWEAFDEEKELYFDNDTYIYDLENMCRIDPEEFISGDYAVDESTDYARDNDLHDWYGYLYTHGDRIAAVFVQPKMDSLLKQRVTSGIIEVVAEDPYVGWTLKLMDARDWSNVKTKWVMKRSPVRINLEKAMIIKGRHVITPKALKKGDRLYILRDDFDGKVIIVK